MKAGDNVLFLSVTEIFKDRVGHPCVIRTIDSHTAVVEFEDGYRMCVYPGELQDPKAVRAEQVKTWERVTGYEPAHDEGSLV